MALPEPSPGLVISYHDQHRAGAEEGRKARPCAIVVATADEDGDTKVYAPITHSQPDDPHAVELPAAVKRRLGLDLDRDQRTQSFHLARLRSAADRTG